MEYLQRKFPERWGKQDKLSVTATNTTTIKDERPDPKTLTDEELRAYMLGHSDGAKQGIEVKS